MNMKNQQYYLFIDTDDVLVNSSPLIQRQVDQNTPFKTTTLKMFEQLNRNCSYYANCVERECQLAYQEKRLPNLSRFPNLQNFAFVIRQFDFDNLSDTQKDFIYHNPVLFAKYYVLVANKFLNLFLEERDIFLETDNLSSGESKNYNYEEEKKVLDEYKEMLSNNYEALTQINYFCLCEIKKIVSNAKKNNCIPQFGDLIKMDSNDILRTNSIGETVNKDYLLYEKPIEDVSICFIYEENIEDIIKNFALMKGVSKEVINYNSIYTMRNVNWEAVLAIKELLDSGLIIDKYNISHQNGAREDSAKERFIYALLPNTKFIGMRFHNEEHHLERRNRSSKMDMGLKLCQGIDPSRMILIDDSIDNCKDWEAKGGRAILYRKITDSEIIRGTLEDTGFRRITEFNGRELIDIVKTFAKEIVKKKTLKGEK